MAARERFLLCEATKLPNVLTLLSLNIAVYAISRLPDASWAAFAVFVCIILDLLDGRVAHLLSSAGKFGSQLDSLADIVAFGVLPALVVLHSHPELAWPFKAASACLYLTCAALRLARFNAKADNGAASPLFEGLPSPAAAGLIAACVVSLDVAPSLIAQHAWPAALVLPIVALTCALLMASTLPYPSFKVGRPAAARRRWTWRRSLFALVAGAGLLANPAVTLLCLFTAYALSTILVRRKINHVKARIAVVRLAMQQRAAQGEQPREVHPGT